MAYFVITKTRLFINGVERNVTVDVVEHSSYTVACAQLKQTAEREVFGKENATLVKYITIDDPAKNITIGKLPVHLDYEYTKENGRNRYKVTVCVTKELT